ncbi:MAG: IS605 OrfB-like transposable element containing RNAse H-like and Zn finger domain [Candidatus Methanohalarchaeum thermophilum]|uniref:IS605 OrfB-like transposable element containing RNAse H-like and Zn finger domain n=1 Tax=Methanohalarchaeum thermophilum TaxID=1903181 RepID=A0A1Q6DTN2_METT1|nr:MAG: IS605 OrfB-like transposable element containing RNAse H-like and Zn finger domain [Candidatus Methanohalarchaeum thermophilum]
MFGKRESNKVDDLVHKVTKWVARYAKENRLAVLGGDIKEISRDTGEGQGVQSRVNTMPIYRLKKYLEYK